MNYLNQLNDIKDTIAMFFHSSLGMTLPKQQWIDNAPRPYDWGRVDVAFIEPDDVHDDAYQIIALGNKLIIKETAMKAFIGSLTKYDVEQLDAITDIISNPRDLTMRLIPYVPTELIDENTEFDYGETCGADYTRIDNKFEKLQAFIFNEFQHISQHISEGSIKYNADNNVAKVDELYIRFNTKDIGKDVNFFMTLTKVPAINVGTDVISASMHPISEEDKSIIFNYPVRQKAKAESGVLIKEEIDNSLSRINDRIHAFLNSDYVTPYPDCEQYAIKLINGVLIPTIVTIQLEPYAVFGGNAKSLFNPEEENVNSTECCCIVDEMITKLFTHLKNIPIPEGSNINYYSIDHDSFGIYGRDANHKVVQAMVDTRYMFATVFEPTLSPSFTEAFKYYLKTVKNKYVFTQIGKVDQESITLKGKKH